MAKNSPSAPSINIGISEEDRAAIAGGLSKLLADTYTLYLTTHNFHWNVTGPMFNTLHTMFMEQYTELWNAVDPVAERIRSLGHPAPGSYAQFGSLSTIEDAPTAPPKAMEMVLTGELYPIETFHELRFINYLEDTPDAVRARAQALAERIRDNAPLSVMAGKESILTAMSAGCDAGMALAHNIYRAAYASEDAQEGPRAFAEKRKPVWKGR